MAKKPQFGSIRQRGRIWWIRYYRDGRRFDESAKSESYEEAEKLLKRRIAEIYAGTHSDPKSGKALVSSLLDDLLLDYKVNGKSEWAELVIRTHLRDFFGHIRVSAFTVSLAQRYVVHRKESKGAANATINHELALLHRAFTLAKESGKIATVPMFPRKLKENNVRKGFFERSEFLALREALPEEMRPVVTFAYWTGCRKEEILSLRWAQVDLSGPNGLVRLEPGETKNDEARVIPFIGELHVMLSMQKVARDTNWPDCPWVFFRNGKRIKRFDVAWANACKAAKLVDAAGEPSRIFHDFRRTGVRNLVRAGVPERVAMRISGHKTRSVFDRYNIVDEQDLHDAARRLGAYIDGMATPSPGQNGDNSADPKNHKDETQGQVFDSSGADERT